MDSESWGEAAEIEGAKRVVEKNDKQLKDDSEAGPKKRIIIKIKPTTLKTASTASQRKIELKDEASAENDKLVGIKIIKSAKTASEERGSKRKRPGDDSDKGAERGVKRIATSSGFKLDDFDLRKHVLDMEQTKQNIKYLAKN